MLFGRPRSAAEIASRAFIGIFCPRRAAALFATASGSCARLLPMRLARR